MDSRFAGNAYRHFLIWGICTSLATAVCTIVDALLVGNLIGSDGLAVANISTPVFLIYALLGVTVGVGANVHIGRQLGASDTNGANRTFGVQLTVGIMLGVVMLTPLLFKDAYFSFLGVTEELYPLAEQYLTVVLWSAPVFIMYHILSVSVRTDSDPRLTAFASATVIITNITLDVVFMKLLDMGIIGASASLCIAETLGVIVLLTHFSKKQAVLKLRFCMPRLGEVISFITNGFGIGSANIFGAVVMLVFNTLLLRSGESGATLVAIYGVIYTVSTIPAAVFDGSANALSTVTSFFIGESDTDSIFAVLKKAVRTTLILSVVAVLVFVLCAEAIIHFFGIKDAQTVDIAVRALRAYSVSILFTAVNMVVTAFWQSIGRARPAGIMSVIRNCIIMIIAGILLIPGLGISGLAIAYILSEALCTAAVIIILLCSSSRKYVADRYGSSGRCFENNYVIRTESMEQISGDLEALCEQWDIGMKQALLINLICEELLLNIIKFAVGDTDKEYYISIRLMERGEDYILRIRDNVSLYNPFESGGDEIDSGILKLIESKTKYCDYQRKMIFNYLYMVI